MKALQNKIGEGEEVHQRSKMTLYLAGIGTTHHPLSVLHQPGSEVYFHIHISRTELQRGCQNSHRSCSHVNAPWSARRQVSRSRNLFITTFLWFLRDALPSTGAFTRRRWPSLAGTSLLAVRLVGHTALQLRVATKPPALPAAGPAAVPQATLLTRIHLSPE